jgi:O-acetyl-ADP-ribose deacetylase (regulator of RNase III)
MISLKRGDLFSSPAGVILAHGCNCQGFMGAGIAAQFSKRFPVMADQYSAQCKLRMLRPGDIFPWVDKSGRVIYNLMTQDRGGPDARTSWIEASVQKMFFHVSTSALRDAEIAIPRIGAGIGGLNWEDVLDGLVSVTNDFPSVKLTVYSI